MTQHTTPEGTLARIEELSKINDSEGILSLAKEFYNNSKKKVYTKTIDLILYNVVNHCIKLRKINDFKECLYFYRIMTSLRLDNYESMLSKIYLQIEKEYKMNYDELKKTTIDDLDLEQSPEKLIMDSIDLLRNDNNLSSEEGIDNNSKKNDFILLMKFTWTAYKFLLELARVNNKLLILYNKILNSCFLFCINLNRKLEFKRIADSVRGYLDVLLSNKQYSVPNKLNISKSDTIKTLINSRLSVFKTGLALEQWQECFKTVEGIVTLFNMFNELKENEVEKKKVAIPNNIYTMYYNNLSELFLQNGYYLYYGFSLIKLKNYVNKLKRNIEVLNKTKPKLAESYISLIMKVNEEELCNGIVYSYLLGNYNKEFNKIGFEVLEGITDRDLGFNQKIKSALELDILPSKEYLYEYINNNNILVNCNEDLKTLFLKFGEINNSFNCLDTRTIGNNTTYSYLESRYTSNLKNINLAVKCIDSLNSDYNANKIKIFLYTDNINCNQNKNNNNLDITDILLKIKCVLISISLNSIAKVYKSIPFKRLEHIFKTSFDNIRYVLLDISKINNILNISNTVKCTINNSKQLVIFEVNQKNKISTIENKLKTVYNKLEYSKIEASKIELVKDLGSAIENSIKNYQILNTKQKEYYDQISKSFLERKDKLILKKEENKKKYEQDIEKKNKDIEMQKTLLLEAKEALIKDNKIKEKIIENLQKYTNSVYIKLIGKNNETKKKLTELLKDLDTFTKEDIFSCLDAEEQKAKNMKKKHIKEIIKFNDLDTRLKRHLEYEYFNENKNSLNCKNNSLINFNEHCNKEYFKILIERKQDVTNKIKGINNKLVQRYFNNNVLIKKNIEFNNFMKVKKAFELEKIKHIEAQLFENIKKTAIEDKKDLEQDIEKKNATKSVVFTQNTKPKDIKEDTVIKDVPFARSQKAENVPGVIHTNEFSRSTKTQIEIKSDAKDPTVITRPTDNSSDLCRPMIFKNTAKEQEDNKLKEAAAATATKISTTNNLNLTDEEKKPIINKEVLEDKDTKPVIGLETKYTFYNSSLENKLNSTKNVSEITNVESKLEDSKTATINGRWKNNNTENIVNNNIISNNNNTGFNRKVVDLSKKLGETLTNVDSNKGFVRNIKALETKISEAPIRNKNINNTSGSNIPASNMFKRESEKKLETDKKPEATYWRKK